jgi:hypothetical protein
MTDPHHVVRRFIQFTVSVVRDLYTRKALTVFQPERLINMKFVHAPDSEI